MKKTPRTQNIRIYGAALLMRNLVALVQEIDGVRTAEDIEFIHRMRVATRRLRSALPLFGPLIAPKQYSNWIKSIRGITRALGEARDADVQIDHISKFLQPLKPPERAGVKRLLLRLQQRRSLMQNDVIKALERFEKSKIVPDMAEKLAPLDIFKDMIEPNEPELLQLAKISIQEKLAAFLDYEPFIHLPEKVTELHAMRIAAKRLRYTMEYFAPLYKNELKSNLKVLRTSQELLGDIHDCDVWISFIPVFAEEERRRTQDYFGHTKPFNRILPGLQYYLECRQIDRGNLYGSFVESWESWQQQGVWINLQITLDEALVDGQNALAAEVELVPEPVDEE